MNRSGGRKNRLRQYLDIPGKVLIETEVTRLIAQKRRTTVPLHCGFESHPLHVSMLVSLSGNGFPSDPSGFITFSVSRSIPSLDIQLRKVRIFLSLICEIRSCHLPTIRKDRLTNARMVESVDTQDLKSCNHCDCVGSSPTSGTTLISLV